MSRSEPGPRRLRFRVLDAIRRWRMWSPGDRVAVAVSGGPDSLALLDLMLGLRRAHGADLVVITIDHGVRQGSDEDADFVEGLCVDHGLPVVRRTLRPADASEATLRSGRLAVFREVGLPVVTGHHRDDLVETALMGMLRGSGTAGLVGMTPVSVVDGVRMLRPLLQVGRDALAAYLAASPHPWARTPRVDPSNHDPRYLRNRIRHEVVPLLNGLRGGVGETLARSAGFAAADNDLLQEMAQRLPRDAASLRAAPSPILRRVILSYDPDLRAAEVDRVVQLVRGQEETLHLGPWVWSVRGGTLRRDPRDDDGT